ncbi:MAG: GNAT family N-acetyltransferase [Pyrinomonadaceae bacterium]
MKHIILTSKPDGDLTAKWNACLADCQFATHYVTPNYFNDPYIQDGFAVLAIEDDGSVAAVMTGVLDGAKIVSGIFSRPQMAFCKGAARKVSISALIEGVNELHDKAELIELYSWEKLLVFDDLGMHIRPSNTETSVVMIGLSVGADIIFANFSSSRRNNIRKLLRKDLVEIKELETESELAELYEIHCAWNARKGNIADTFEQMHAAAFDRENRRIFICKLDGKVIAGSFYRFAPGGVVEYAANFSMPEYQNLRPNDLIMWRAIEWACNSGFSHFSMGGSHLFLRRFGGEIMTTYRYRRDQSRFRTYELRESVHDFSIAAYKRLPESVRSGMRRVLAR